MNAVEIVQTVAVAIGVVLAALGLSAAPWVTALLRGGLLTRKQHEDRVADLKEQRDKAEARAGTEYERAEVERGRADAANTKLAEVAGGIGRQAVGLLDELRASVTGGDSGGR